MNLVLSKAARWAAARQGPPPKPTRLVKPYAVRVGERALAWAGPLELVVDGDEAQLFWNGIRVGSAQWDGRQTSAFRLDGTISGTSLRIALEAAEEAMAVAEEPVESVVPGEPIENVVQRLVAARAASAMLPFAARVLLVATAPSATPMASVLEALVLGVEQAPLASDRAFLNAVLAGVEETLGATMASPYFVEPVVPGQPAGLSLEITNAPRATPWQQRRQSWCREPGCYLRRGHAPPCRMGMETWI